MKCVLYISYDIKDDKLRNKLSDMLKYFGYVAITVNCMSILHLTLYYISYIYIE